MSAQVVAFRRSPPIDAERLSRELRLQWARHRRDRLVWSLGQNAALAALLVELGVAAAAALTGFGLAALVAMAFAIVTAAVGVVCLRERRAAACWAVAYLRLARRLVAARDGREMARIAAALRSLALIEAMRLPR